MSSQFWVLYLGMLYLHLASLVRFLFSSMVAAAHTATIATIKTRKQVNRCIFLRGEERKLLHTKAKPVLLLHTSTSEQQDRVPAYWENAEQYAAWDV